MDKNMEKSLVSEKTIDETLGELACPIKTRLPLIEPGTETPEVAEIYENCRDLFGIVPRYIQLLAHSPGSARSWLVFDRDIKVAALRADELERSRMQVLCILETSLDNSCHNCSHHNVDLARGLGYSDGQLAAVASSKWNENGNFSDKEKAVLDWSSAVTHLRASRDDESFENMKRHFTDAEIVELTYTTSLWNCSTRFADALHLTAEAPGRGIDWGTD
jgi:alkylhydroperoxidase family enzyme